MQISEGLYSLALSVPIMGQVNVIHPALLLDEQGAILVDTGFPGTLPLLRNTLENLGVALSKLDSVLITHQDIDHIGGLPSLLQAITHPIKVYASELEKPYIQGDTMLIKITPASIQSALANLPADTTPETRDAFRRNLENPPKAPVDTILEDGQEIDRCGGIVVILTPGHTPGHLSLYHKKSKTLLAADSMVVVDGVLEGPKPAYCSDYSLALQSLKKYAQFDIDQVLCYHGGLYTDHANQRIAELANTLKA
ncbi:MBL fold metallo-hydrolase [Paenibacillus qinlingensis]|uniref:Glyoxylase-like metal-dependent hydrolase (Beta-lactamase superfamily II) n=1 Tax=Paenibacillus qinlingensis TaxID=1837343 RepID=A0ABU1NSA8_9BACL|nr:MBL fold metallo-hydrolase [Paenibacillus qinlingensis]MDR6549772.1 glyoxylase-like metal-dependent hydrolase (beta-lactamase superfamily II) [Paenibacillus qinlingensis]